MRSLMRFLTVLLLAGARPALAQGASVLSVQANPAEGTGGSSFDVTVRLSAPAPTGGLTVTFHAGTLLSPPASVVVPQGSTQATVRVPSQGVVALETVSLQASGGGGTASTVVTLRPEEVEIRSVTLLRPGAVAGDPLSGEVTLARPAPTGGVRVAVEAEGGGADTAAIPSGSLSGPFRLVTRPGAEEREVAVVARSGRYTARTVARLYPTPRLEDASMKTTPDGGGSGMLRVKLERPAPPVGGRLKTKVSGDLQVPSEVDLTAGSKEVLVPVKAGAVRKPTWCAVTVDCYGSRREVGFYVKPGADVEAGEALDLYLRMQAGKGPLAVPEPLAPGRTWTLVPAGRPKLAADGADRFLARVTTRGSLSPEAVEHEVLLEFPVVRQGGAWTVQPGRVVEVDGRPRG